MTLTNLLEEIDFIERGLIPHREAVSVGIAKQKELTNAYNFERFGVKPGVRIKEDRTERLFIVDRIDRVFTPGNKPWVLGFLIKKDGTPSIRSQNIFDNWTAI